MQLSENLDSDDVVSYYQNYQSFKARSLPLKFE
jgi:hypothetical protein